MSFNILVVDDSITVRAVIAKTLEMADIPVGEVLEAGDGKQALDILAENWVDIVFADINMPVMNGVEMITKMAEDGMLAKVPVVIVSTEGSTTRIENLKALGVAGYVRKPFQPEDFGQIVSGILGVDHG